MVNLTICGTMTIASFSLLARGAFDFLKCETETFGPVKSTNFQSKIFVATCI